MKVAVLDTSAILNILKGEETGKRIAGSLQTFGAVFLPVIVKSELFTGVIERKWGTQRLNKLDELMKDFICLSVPCEKEIIDAYQFISTFLKENGKSIGQNDIWISAICLHLQRINYNVSLITCDKGFLHLKSIIKIDFF